jgi:DNA-binding response OmpR family regulator
VFYPCTPKEILTRAGMALDRKPGQSVRSPEVQFRVLLVDDDPGITDLLRVTLDKEDMTCRSTAQSLDALKIAREWNPDIVVLDINMPDMDGYQVLAALKATSSDAPMRVLMLTACHQEAEVLKGFKLGAEDYIVKPFNPADLLMRVRRIVRKAA